MVTAYCNEKEIESRSFCITVVDTTPPVITLPASITVLANTPDGADNVVYGTASATDLVTADPSVWFDPDCEGTVFPLGVTLVTVNAMDDAGNLAQATFTVTVEAAALGISELEPADGSVTPGRQPVISALLSDSANAIAWSTLSMTLDGNPIAADHSGMAVSYTPAADLAEGEHQAAISVCDEAGNFASAQWSFAVVIAPPRIDFLSPFDGMTVYVSDLTTVCAWFSDSGDGVDPTSVVLSLDGNPLTGAYATETYAYADVSASFNAEHQVTVIVADKAGRKATQTNSFYVIDPPATTSQDVDLVVGETKEVTVHLLYDPLWKPATMMTTNGGCFAFPPTTPCTAWGLDGLSIFKVPITGITGRRHSILRRPGRWARRLWFSTLGSFK